MRRRFVQEYEMLIDFIPSRQENMGMQAKYGALEMKSKELLAQQGSAVSGASVALNSLGGRLEQLVEQLIASYNISEQELEVNIRLAILGMRFLGPHTLSSSCCSLNQYV